MKKRVEQNRTKNGRMNEQELQAARSAAGLPRLTEYFCSIFGDELYNLRLVIIRRQIGCTLISLVGIAPVGAGGALRAVNRARSACGLL